ncbi:MAG: D-aminoacyl-tRNA deacylase [Bacillota bacterium]|nr:D-aminoacyl-tRNA deacylase [Bacillota bacterium]
MRAVVQRTRKANVEVEGKIISAITGGLVIFLGVGKADEQADANYLADKIAGLRIFEDQAGLMNLSIKEKGGEILCISQFTLLGDCRKGRRPGFSDAAFPEKANILYDYFCEKLRQHSLTVAVGRFQSHMLVSIENDGPVTILLDSKKTF